MGGYTLVNSVGNTLVNRLSLGNTLINGVGYTLVNGVESWVYPCNWCVCASGNPFRGCISDVKLLLSYWGRGS